MFRRPAVHRGEIKLDILPDLSPEAWELARFWVNADRSFVAVGRTERWSPELLGSLIVECLHTAAAGYAGSGAMSEEEALERIWRGVDEERARLNGQSPSKEVH